MKKMLVMVLVATFMAGTLSACGKKNAPKYKSSQVEQTGISAQS